MTGSKIKVDFDISNLDKIMPELIFELAFANEDEVDLFIFNLMHFVEDRKLMRLLMKRVGVV